MYLLRDGDAAAKTIQDIAGSAGLGNVPCSAGHDLHGGRVLEVRCLGLLYR